MKANSLSDVAALVRAEVVIDEGGCWIWQGPKNRYGYGVTWFQGKKWSIHRLHYTATRGEIPDGLHIDHLCHTESETCSGGRGCQHRACVNPDHMEPVSSAANSRRSTKSQQTECLRGHEYTPENTGRTSTTGTRFCRICARESWRRYRARLQAAA